MTFGAFMLGVGILITLINVMLSMRFGAIAGRNPWNSDGLEWETDSPPKPYATVHIPMVVSRHPLWDDYDEDADPDGDRLLDTARLTLTSSWLDALPLSIATMPEDTLIPLFLSVTMLSSSSPWCFRCYGSALAAFVATFLLGCVWLWPRPIKGEL